MNLTAFRSLSRAILRGFVRDRTALVFSILLPVLFLALFGSIYKSVSTPKLTVLEVGRVSLLSGAGSQQGLGKVLTVTHTQNLPAALTDVRKGTYDAAVQQQGRTLTVHYSIADQTTAGIVQTVFASIVQQADQASAGPGKGFTLQSKQVENTSLKPIQYVTPGLLGWAIASGAAFCSSIKMHSRRIGFRRISCSAVEPKCSSGWACSKCSSARAASASRDHARLVPISITAPNSCATARTIADFASDAF